MFHLKSFLTNLNLNTRLFLTYLTGTISQILVFSILLYLLAIFFSFISSACFQYEDTKILRNDQPKLN